MKKLFSFRGRISRSDYWVFFFICNSVNYLLLEVTDDSLQGFIIYFAFFIPLICIFFAQGSKRSHDIGDSGFCQILPWHYLSLLFKEGNKGTNEYGKNPKSNNL